MNPGYGTGINDNLPVGEKEMIEIFVDKETGVLGWESGHLASIKEFDLADRCVGSVFESLEPGEGVILDEGLFVLDEDLDLQNLKEFKDSVYAEVVSEESWHEFIGKLASVNPDFAQAVNEYGFGHLLTLNEQNNSILFDFESGCLFNDLPQEWRDWIASDSPGRDNAYELCADWAMRFAAEVFKRIK